MDAISFSVADKQAKRIKKFINEPDLASGIVTVPKVIATGETVTIPTGRVAVLPNLQIDGTLDIQGDVFIPSGATFEGVVEKVASTDNAIVRFDGTTGAVQNSLVTIDDTGKITNPGGLQLPNTNIAGNVLDWYEEGTFTPTVYGGTTAGTYTSVTALGIYTRVGSIVYFSARLVYSGHTGTGRLVIGGLPFQSFNNASIAVYSITIAFNNYTNTAGSIQPFIVQNSNTIQCDTFVSNAGSVALPIDIASDIYISGSYRV